MKRLTIILLFGCIAGKEINAQSRYLWVTDRSAAVQMVGLMQQAETFGLDTLHYNLNALVSFLDGSNKDSALFEKKLTDAATHFFKDLAYGSAPPAVGYNGLKYSPSCYDISAALTNAINSRTLDRLAETIQPASAEYLSVKAKMNQLQRIVSVAGFKDERGTSTAANATNKPLLKRLYQLGILDSIPSNIPDTALKTRIKNVQGLFNLLPDGNIRQPLLKELNAPLKQRITELKLALNTIRWLSCARAAGPVIVVNIPSANLLVYENDQVILESRIIVGKKSTRTPTLTSKANEVILYPYWMVRKSIATKELLPHIKRDPGYIDANGMQVLNQQGRVVNPWSVNWDALSASYFPYVLRQSTGCDNSLGLVKLNFYNPYNVYLHDTPWKILFAANKRYFSHGCMRVERAMELAHLLLAGNTIAVDTLEDRDACAINCP